MGKECKKCGSENITVEVSLPNKVTSNMTVLKKHCENCGNNWSEWDDD